MHEVAIVGAGELGGTLAHLLARRGTAASVRLIDEAGQVGAGKALDITQAAPIEGFATRVSGRTDLGAIGQPHVVVLADRAGGGEWRGDEALLLLTRLRAFTGQSVVLCAGAQQLELVERGVREIGMRREGVFGSAPEALAGALRAMVALETDGSARDVALTVLGVPPSHVFVPWEEASIAGLAARHLLDEPARRRLSARIAPLWPPGPYALAAAAAKAIDAIFGRSKATIAAFVAPDDSAGRKARAGALPVRLGPSGIVQVESPALTAHDQIALDNALLL
jgi:malate dehydrogenase